jgi:hypothetical protein
MLSKLISTLKWFAILSAIIYGLKELGLAINNVINWQILTDAFSIVRYYIDKIDWIMPAELIIALIGLELSFLVAEWIFMAILIPIDHKLKAD